MFRPNLKCIIHNVEKYDINGRPQPVVKSPDERCAIVKLITSTEKSAVRADTSASRGSAMEEVADAVLLFPRYTKADINDVIEIKLPGAVVKLQIVGKFPRHDVTGRFDHWEISANMWKDA